MKRQFTDLVNRSFLIDRPLLLPKFRMHANSPQAHIKSCYRASQHRFASSAPNQTSSPLTKMASRTPSPSTASYTHRPCWESHLPTSLQRQSLQTTQTETKNLHRARSNGNADYKYAIDRIVRHIENGINTKLIARWYGCVPIEQTIKLAEHNPQHLNTRYWKRLNKRKRN